MSDSVTNISEKYGMSPGSLVHVGNVLEAESRMSIIDYSNENLDEQSIKSVNEILPYIDKETVTWLNVEGLNDVEHIESIGSILNIHPLVLEDILNTHQRPKFEEYDHYLYIVLKKLTLGNEKFSVSYEQISILVLDNFVVTFTEKSGDLFEPLKQRLMNSKGRLRNMGSDYLTYAILDTIVDRIFVLLDVLDETIESIEEELLTNLTSATLAIIQQLKRDLIYIRKSISPLRA